MTVDADGLAHDSETTRRWERAQDEDAARRLRAWPGGGRLREQVLRADVESRVFAPTPSGGRWFRLVVLEGEAEPLLFVSDRPDDRGRVLVDPGSGTLDWYFPSPDGQLVAYGLSERGSEQSVLHLVDVETGELRPERIPHTSFAVVAWLPDSTGFYFSASLGPDTEQPQKHIFFHRVGAEPPTQPEPAVFRDDEDFVSPQVSDDGRWVAAVSSDAEPRPDSILDRHGDGVWRPFLLDVPAVFNGFFLDDRYLAVTTEDAPRGRLVSIPLTTPTDRATWTEIVPQGEAVLRSVAAVGDRLVLEELVDTSTRLRVIRRDGTEPATVPLPQPGVAALSTSTHRAALDPAVAADEGGFTFVRSSWETAPAVCRYDLRTGQVEVLEERPPPPFEVEAFLVEARAPDGARVTAWVVRRLDADQRPAPTLVHGYGGWNIAFGTPVGLGPYRPFVEAGGTMVFAHLRGGGEYGFDQWLDGFREAKQHTFDDLYAVVEHLVDAGVAALDRVGVVGASNGGLLTAAAITQRPELFAAAVSHVPLTDMLTYTRDPYAAEFVLEYGDPAEPAAAAWLRAYSPLHAVRDGVPYPATLVICGDTDVRCPAWHGRVFVARVQAATASDAPVLYRLRPDSGHLTSIRREN
ncbi:MAG: Prolyl endopeptidase, partial [uncultured Thermoleophilia bacterium]